MKKTFTKTTNRAKLSILFTAYGGILITDS